MQIVIVVVFLSTLSLRRATEQSASYNAYLEISIHALLAESDIGDIKNTSLYELFLSTLSLRRATNSAYGALDGASISIHALLAESDTSSTVIVILRKNFYPRSPCGERRGAPSSYSAKTTFLSTLSLRRATPPAPQGESTIKFLSTLSLRRATVLGIQHRAGEYISIHALLAESDLTIMLYDSSALIFLSTLSLRRATCLSILLQKIFEFLSTLSLRRATHINRGPYHIKRFLSTLSLRRATLTNVVSSAGTMDFYPRSPCGERLKV